MDDALVEQIKQKHPGIDLVLLSSKSAEVVAKVTSAEVDMFRELVTNPATKGKAMVRFVRACIVHPGADEVKAILDKKPALVEKWGDELLDEAGHDEEVTRKKL